MASGEKKNAPGGVRSSSAQASVLGGRTMPESLEAEAAVLGSMVIDNFCISDVVEKLNADAFYRSEHQMIFEAILSLYEKNRGGTIDGVLIRDELKKRKQLADIGGAEYLGRIIGTVPSAANVEYYIGIVKDKWLLREIIGASSGIINDAYDPGGETKQKLDDAERRIFAITDKNITVSAESLKDLVMRAYETIESREGKHVTGLPTGYFELDDMTCGLQRGEMIIIAGRPSMGKTSFALNVAEHIGVDNKMPLAVFSLEMGKQQLAERFLCSRGKVESQLVRKGMLSAEHHAKLHEACGTLYEAPIFIDDTATLSPLELRAKARRLKNKHDIQCIMIDYLQLMNLGFSRVESRQQEITSISRHLKALARELDVPVVVLSQLNRSAEGREGHKPRMSDLRESGSIEQDADVVMLLHREDYYHRGETDYQQTNTAELIIAKQRNGPTGVVDLTFVEKYTRFENVSQGISAAEDYYEDSSHEAVPF